MSDHLAPRGPGERPRPGIPPAGPSVGEEELTRLVAAFYARVPRDEVLGPMYPAGDFAGAEERLRDFLVFRLGGSDRYLRTRGHPRLRMRHAPFPIDATARDRWLEHMEAALDGLGLDAERTEALRDFFRATATFLVNRPG